MSILIWAFVGTSLILCTAFLGEYAKDPRQIGRLVLGSSILGSIAVSSIMTVVARRFSISKILGEMAGEPYSGSGLVSSFRALCEKMGIRTADLRLSKTGNAFSIGLGGQRIVAVSPGLVGSLSVEEGEAVLAHELSHLKNHDSRWKGLARLARFAFPFDPSVRLIEAAIHRERELLADKESVRHTGKPLALASALLKVHSSPISRVQGLGAGLFIGGTQKGILSLYPDLEHRIELLLKIASRMKPLAEVPAAAQQWERSHPKVPSVLL